jgi:hypothetical protein
MVNDLAINHKDRWKYVDDTSLSETIGKGCQSNLQSVINNIDQWCTENDMMLNRSKCKELIISFAKGPFIIYASGWHRRENKKC